MKYSNNKKLPTQTLLKVYYDELHNEKVEREVEATRKNDLIKYLDQSRKKVIKNSIRSGCVALDLGGGDGGNYKLLEPFYY